MEFTVKLWANEEVRAEFKDGTLRLDGKVVSEEMFHHLLAFGTRQCIKDAAAGEKEDDKRNAAAYKKVDAIVNGTLREGSGGGQRLTLLERQMREVAVRMVRGALLRNNQTATQGAIEKAAKALLVAREDEIRQTAQAEVDAMAAAADEADDIMALLK